MSTEQKRPCPALNILRCLSPTLTGSQPKGKVCRFQATEMALPLPCPGGQASPLSWLVVLQKAKQVVPQFCSATFLSSWPPPCSLLPCHSTSGAGGVVFFSGEPSCVLSVYHMLYVARKACHLVPVP